MISLRRGLSIAQTALISKNIDQKVVVIESDDWGSLRTPINAIEEFQKLNIDLSKSPYHKYDFIESTTDVYHVTDELKKFEQESNRKVKVTLNYVMCNPDFDKIEASKFQKYYPEDFTVTYLKKWGDTKTLDAVKEGIQEGFFKPQFHGREHVHVPVWLELLRSNDTVINTAFKLGFSGLEHDLYPIPERKLQAALDARHKNDLEFMTASLKDGLDKFYATFGFLSESMIPNNYIWPNVLEPVLVNAGVKYLQGMKMLPHNLTTGSDKRKYTIRASGRKNQSGLLNIVRNTAFEPSYYENKEKELLKCLNEIKVAFLLKQPAVISMHRLNFVGGISEKNRIENLTLFSALLKAIVKEWPDVKFWDSAQLGDYFDVKYTQF